MSFDCYDDILDTSSLPLLEKLMRPTAVSRGDQRASYNRTTCKHLPTRKRVMGGFFPHYSSGPNQSLKSTQNKRIAVLRYAGADNIRLPTLPIRFPNTPIFLLPRFFMFSHTDFLHSTLTPPPFSHYSNAPYFFSSSHTLPKVIRYPNQHLR